MTQSQKSHAQKVADRFRAILDESGEQCLNDNHYDELSLLVEAAIDAALIEKEEMIADRLQKMAQEIRSDAEHFDLSS
jgi:hypothetical protein